MTTVGVISDTHLPRVGRALPRALVRGQPYVRPHPGAPSTRTPGLELRRFSGSLDSAFALDQGMLVDM